MRSVRIAASGALGLATRRRTRRAALVAAAVLVLGAAAWVLIGGRLGESPSVAGARSPVPTGTARVVRTDVVVRQQLTGTLGYAHAYSVVASAAGTVTHAPAPGAVVVRGRPLYELDGEAVPLLYGTRPAWRTFRIGMTAGKDVRELERNLVALGLDPARRITVDDRFTRETALAVEHWQQARGLAQTGTVPLGRVAFLPGPVRVVALAAPIGAAVVPGAPLLSASSTRPAVSMLVDPAFQEDVHRGERVVVTLPSGRTVAGAVAVVSRVAVGAPASQAGSGDQGQDQPAGIPVTVALLHPRAVGQLDQAPVQVAIATSRRRGVLAVPISALLARSGGGYGVIAVEGGRRRAMRVQTGLFDDTSGMVEVRARRLTAGMEVEVPSG